MASFVPSWVEIGPEREEEEDVPNVWLLLGDSKCINKYGVNFCDIRNI